MAGVVRGVFCKALTDDEIATACDRSFEQMIDHPEAKAARVIPRNIARSIHKYGFHDGGAFASDHDALILGRLIRAIRQLATNHPDTPVNFWRDGRECYQELTNWADYVLEGLE
jgi:hypothetical protein